MRSEISAITSISRTARHAVRISLTMACVIIPTLTHAQKTDPLTIARGAYLAKIADCAGCHTAGPGHQPFVGGLPITSPFGVIYSTNITPDPATGIGKYTYADFSRAVRDGIARNGKRLYPAMPFASFAATSESDIEALYAYFMYEVKPVRYVPPQTKLPFPFNQRWALWFWKKAFARQEPFKTRSDRDAEWNRGAYLVQALGHCGACHTPRGLAFQEKGYSEASPYYLSGAVIDNWFAANLTSNRASGLGRWTESEVAAFLKTGHARRTVASGSMITVIENSTQYLRDEDLDAIAHYLKSLPAREGEASYQPQPRKTAIVLAGIETGPFEPPGAGLYSGFCAKCHDKDGSGKTSTIPALAGSSVVLSDNATSLIRLTLEGGKGPVTEHGPKPKKMPGYASDFTDRQIADVLTFIRASWGNSAPPVTSRDVSLLRKAIRK